MPLSKTAKGIKKKFKDKYGEKQGERFYYATANKQGRKPETFKKESITLVNDLIINGNIILKSGTVLEKNASSSVKKDTKSEELINKIDKFLSETVTTGGISAGIDIPIGNKKEDDDDEEDEEDEEDED
jgi:hypothetical protein